MYQFAKHGGVESIIDHILNTDNLTLQVCRSSVILYILTDGKRIQDIVCISLLLCRWISIILMYTYFCMFSLLLVKIYRSICSVQELTALFQPFGVCDEYINVSYFKNAFRDCVLYGINFVENMPEADMKNKVKPYSVQFWYKKTLANLLK